MKTLYLIRHAKSSWDDPSLRDEDRPLNERGLRDAPRMGKRLKEKDVVPDLMISSPANRALTTCRIIGKILKYREEHIKLCPELYHASEEDILHVVHTLNNKHDEVLIFGHNPGITEFANRLTNEHIINIPTCGIAACALNIDHWEETDWGKGKLLFFDFPKSKND